MRCGCREWLSVAACLLIACAHVEAAEPLAAQETPTQAAARHERVARRRKSVYVVCHRGAAEFAHENTLEAFRAALELGADGNEIDIRSTKDGVLVCFHDDMLDRLLAAYGDASDYTWEELQRFEFRDPKQFGEQCRIPTLAEAFELHRRYGGLLHLDIKRPDLDRQIAELLTRLDLWDHVVACNAETGGIILQDARYRPGRYKAGLYLDRSEVFPEAIAKALERPGEGLIVDDPRGALIALDRKIGRASKQPVAPRTGPPPGKVALRSEAELIAAVTDAADWNRVPESDDERLAAGRRIVARAQAADELLQIKTMEPAALAALARRVRERSLHPQWMYHGLDGAQSLRALIRLQAAGAADVARFALWRDDPALEPVIDPRFKNPRAWTDFRVKMVVFPALAHCPGAASEQLCRDYLALEDDAATKLGPQQFEEAGRTLLAVNPTTETALELMSHRLQVVRGRAILDCLAHREEDWARGALRQGAPHALAYIAND